MSGRDELLEAMSESAWQRRVNGLLRFYGWRHYHAPDNKPRRDGNGRAGRQHVEAGFPDVVAIRRLPGYGPELVIAELKAERGRYGPGQREWLADLDALSTAVAGIGHELLTRGLPSGWQRDYLPAIGVYTWRPSDEADVERILAGPRGPGLIVDAD